MIDLVFRLGAGDLSLVLQLFCDTKCDLRVFGILRVLSLRRVLYLQMQYMVRWMRVRIE